MQINTLVGSIYEANCYILTFETYAVVIDPCVSYNEIKKITKDLEIKAVFITHAHADHFCYLKDLKDNVEAKIYCHKNAREKIEDPKKNYSMISKFSINFTFNNEDYIYVHEGSVVEIKDAKFKIIETPGHSNCSICININEVMFTGDTLFYHTIGRTDLYSSNTYDMTSSVKKLKNLKADYIVYPGHGQKTTLSHEKEYNRYFKV